MARDATIDAAMAAGTVYPFMLAEFDFPSGFVRFWTGVGPLSWDGETWTGSGTLFSVSEVTETKDVVASGVTFQLSGVPSEFIAIAAGEHYQGRAAKLWIGVLDATGALLGDPYPVFIGRMDVMSIEDNAETATITVTVENRLIDLERVRVRRYTDEDQKALFPGDRGLEYVAGIQDVPLVWGRTR